MTTEMMKKDSGIYSVGSLVLETTVCQVRLPLKIKVKKISNRPVYLNLSPEKENLGYVFKRQLI